MTDEICYEGWKEHTIRQGDGGGGWRCTPADFQFLHYRNDGHTMPFGLARMDNGEVLLVGSWTSDDDKTTLTIVGRSADRGDTWSLEAIDDAHARPMMLADLGKGNLTFVHDQRYFSSDYGRTWPERVPLQDAPNGRRFCEEGNPLVDRDEHGVATRIAEIGYNYAEGAWPMEPCDAWIRWSYDGGRTWKDAVQPEAWRFQSEYEGKPFPRSVCEGSLVRAQNGWLVAVLRNDVLGQFLPSHNDNLCGTGFSVSKDDGKTWSPFEQIHEAGRMHAHLVRTPDGDLVMGYIVRQDIRGGGPASYRKGCEALVSSDNGVTWDPSRRYVLDDWPYCDPGKSFIDNHAICGHTCSTTLDDGRLLTAYSNYVVKGAALIRWSP